MYVPAWIPRKILGADLIVRVNPQGIRYRATSPCHLNPFIAKEDSKLKYKLYMMTREWHNFSIVNIHGGYLIENGRHYAEVIDIWKNRNQIHDSDFYNKAHRKILSGKSFKYKKRNISDVGDIIPLISESILDMLFSLERDGYIDEKTSAHSDSNIGMALIDAAGAIVPTRRARHRMAAARIVGVDRGFPLQIEAIHKDHLGANGIYAFSDLSKIPQIVRRAGEELNTRFGAAELSE